MLTTRYIARQYSVSTSVRDTINFAGGQIRAVGLFATTSAIEANSPASATVVAGKSRVSVNALPNTVDMAPLAGGVHMLERVSLDCTADVVEFTIRARQTAFPPVSPAITVTIIFEVEL